MFWINMSRSPELWGTAKSHSKNDTQPPSLWQWSYAHFHMCLFCLVSLEGSACAVVFDCKFIETSASLHHNVREPLRGHRPTNSPAQGQQGRKRPPHGQLQAPREHQQKGQTFPGPHSGPEEQEDGLQTEIQILSRPVSAIKNWTNTLWYQRPEAVFFMLIWGLLRLYRTNMNLFCKLRRDYIWTKAYKIKLIMLAWGFLLLCYFSVFLLPYHAYVKLCACKIGKSTNHNVPFGERWVCLHKENK